MKTKTFRGVNFKVYEDTKIDGDFINLDEAVYFENDIEITGDLKVKYLKAEKSIKVGGNYQVEKFDEVGEWQEVGGSQEVGWWQKIGEWQEVGWWQKIGEWQEVGGSQKVGWWQKIGEWQKVGWWQKIGEWQKVGGWQEVGGSQEVGGWQEVGGDLKAGSARISLYSKVGGKYEVKGKVFIGVCEWKETTDGEETLTCGRFVSGYIKYGKVKETGLREKQQCDLSGKEVEVKIDGKSYKAIIQ